MSRKFTEAEIERAVKETVDKVSENMPRPEQSGSRFELATPWDTTFYSGDIFKAQTVSGGHNYIIFMLVNNGWVYYCHGDRSKKVPYKDFMNLIEDGSLEYVSREKTDPERMSLAVLGLQAMANGLTFNDYLKVIYGYGDGSDAGNYSV